MTTNRPDSRAPRFSAYITRAKGHRVIVVAKRDWQTMGDTGVAGSIDLARTPLSRVAHDSCFIAAVAERFSPSKGYVTVCRYDEQDDPTPYNLDRYEAWENLHDNPNLPMMIEASDTCASSSLSDYLRCNVFLVKAQPDENHWQSSVPEKIRIAMEKAGQT